MSYLECYLVGVVFGFTVYMILFYFKKDLLLMYAFLKKKLLLFLKK